MCFFFFAVFFLGDAFAIVLDDWRGEFWATGKQTQQFLEKHRKTFPLKASSSRWSLNNQGTVWPPSPEVWEMNMFFSIVSLQGEFSTAGE